MFSVPHLAIIFVLALIVFGPEKLPDLARNLGKVMGEFRRATGDLRSTFESHMRDLEREAELRKVREAQPVAQTPVAAEPENSIGGGLPAAALPLSTPESSDAVDPASALTDLTPPAGTVPSARPNAAAFPASAPSTPQQLDFDSQGQSSDPSATEPDQTSDGRTRPA